MNYSFGTTNSEYNYDTYTMLVLHNKILYKRNQQIKYNFRENINEQKLNEGILINFPYSNVYYSYKCKVKDIPLSKVFKRAGVIPYVTVKDAESNYVKYFCMAIDSKYGNITDFGGGVKKYETFARAAARELIEESLGIFKISPESLYECSTAAFDNNMITLFCHIQIDKDMSSLVLEYFERFSLITNSETRGIIWIPENIFYNLIKTGRSIRTGDMIYPSIYKNVADLLRSISNINEIV
jgi:hypothetical protein